MFSKINVLLLVKNHLSTLKNDNSQKFGADDCIIFLIAPVIVAVVMSLMKVVLSDQTINIIITTLAIFVGLLFNVIVLIFDIVNRDASQKLKNRFLKEILTNISFTILLSILTIFFTVLTYIDKLLIKEIATGIVYFLLTSFSLTVVMVLKRMYILFRNEIDEIENAADNKREQ